MSTTEATASLMAAMSLHNLHPSQIKWDTGSIQRFDSPLGKRGNKAAWYIVHSDPPEAGAFGDWKTGLETTWKNDDYQPDDGLDMAHLRAEWRKRDKKREAERKKKATAAAAKCQKRWDGAAIADTDHPYLVRKGIAQAPGIRQDRNTLLIPLKSMQTGKLVSLQTISADGDKLFAKDSFASGARTTIGQQAFKRTNVIYVTEGWATGWTIHRVTGDAVVVAFFAANLVSIAEGVRSKYPGAEIIVAADNDRWTETPQMQNPGVTFGARAAGAALASLAVPDFLDLATEPTDFNDLWMLEGSDAVRAWLDTSSGKAARTTVDGSEPTVTQAPPPAEDEGPHEELGPWTATAPFRCLGYDRLTYYYLPRGTGQIHGLGSTQHRRETLLTIAPMVWWEHQFPARQGADWACAADALFRASERSGVFRPERLRGRGCWNDPKGVVLHLGDRLLAPGGNRYVDPEDFQDSKRLIYERQQRIDGPSTDRALDTGAAGDILDLFKDLLWHEDASGVLCAGWTALAPLCGALKWRPHIWITGGTGSGKSTVMRELILPLLGGTHDDGGMNRYYEGSSTEAGMRQELRADALPVLYDEAEKTDIRSDARLQNVLALARSASSSDGAHTAKGTTHGTAMTFQVRSMFCLASIGGAVRQEADKTRIGMLQLRSNDSVGSAERRSHWKGYAPRLKALTVTHGRELMARTLGWLRDGRLDDTLAVFKGAASVLLGDTRAGDQFGTLYAGAWTLMADEPPGEQEAREVLGAEGLDDYIAEQVPEGRKALLILLQQRERIETSSGPRTVAVGQLIDIAAGEAGLVSGEEATGLLKQIGMKIEVVDGENMLLIATASEWVRKVLRETPYADSIHAALRTLKGVTPGGKMRFHPGLVSHATRVPLSALAD